MESRRLLARVGACAAVALTAASLAADGRTFAAPDQKRAARIEELWVTPPRGRDLYFGVGGPSLRPDPRDLFVVQEIKASGFSDGYVLSDPTHHEWSAKFPPEGPPEVVSSRLLWGIGYHQPPIYLLESWRAEGANDLNPQRPARFRAKKPAFHGLDDKGGWSYTDNPFVGTRPLAGLLVLQAMLGNSDLKDENNALYELNARVEGARRWYVARDLGQTLGRTGKFDPPRADIEAFETTPFIRSVTDGIVTLDYRGRHAELYQHITVADVRWACTQLSRLSDKQLRDAFRAGGFDAAISTRFIRRLKSKIAEGLALRSPKGSS